MATPVVEDLRRRIREAEGSYGDAEARRHVPLGIAAFDAALPGGGLPAGALTEILASETPGGGAWTFAAMAACAAARDGGRVLWVDDGTFSPVAAAALGLDLERLFLVRPRTASDALWIFEQAIRCRAVAAAVADLRGLSSALARRLQLAAELGQGLALLVRPDREAAVPSAAAVRLRVAPAPSVGIGPEGAARTAWLPPRAFTVEVLRARGGFGSAVVRCEVNDGTGARSGAPAARDRSRDAGRRSASA